MMTEATKLQVGIITPAPLLQVVRAKLTANKSFGDRVLKWGSSEITGGSAETQKTQLFLVYTNVETVSILTTEHRNETFIEENDSSKNVNNDDIDLFSRFGLETHCDDLQIFKVVKGKKPTLFQQQQRQQKSIYTIIEALISRYVRDGFLDPKQSLELVSILERPQRYCIYEPLLLLGQSHIFASTQWKNFIQLLPQNVLDETYAAIAQEFGVSHIAINAPVPTVDGNEMRRPVDLLPLYGDFGSTDHNDANFDSALWVSTKQNGVYQTWPPCHVMFSRGNLREKARLMSHFRETIQNNIDEPSKDDKVTVVDLYVGIGYFTFSYVKSGAAVVLGWDINRWSIEACRRGAVGNGWQAVVVCCSNGDMTENSSVKRVEGAKPRNPKILLFHESNSNAVDRIASMKAMVKLPPVAHINLGILPTSRQSYLTAVQITLLNDPPRVCWVHVHENTSSEEIDGKKQDIVDEFKRLLMVNGVSNHPNKRNTGGKWDVECTHVECVKSWAPNVYHYVFDIKLSPIIIIT